jgi:DedD protein
MAQSPTNDELLVLKKRARRRLVGAVALVLISIIVLWNVLDREPKTARQPVSAQDVAIISDAPQINTAPAKSDKQASPFAEPVTPATPPATPTEHSEPQAPLVDAAVTAEKQVKSEAKIAEPAQAPEKKEVKKEPAPKKDEHKAEEKKITPKPEKHETKAESKDNKPAADEHKSQLIQVAALSDAGKAKALVDKLAAHGVKAYTEQKGELTRVRVGPFASREQAEKALAKIQAAGASGVIVSK